MPLQYYIVAYMTMLNNDFTDKEETSSNIVLLLKMNAVNDVDSTRSRFTGKNRFTFKTQSE